MGQLPTLRVTQARPFHNSGIDYCGPFKICGKKTHTAYIAIFCCFATKAVHLELVSEENVKHCTATLLPILLLFCPKWRRSLENVKEREFRILYSEGLGVPLSVRLTAFTACPSSISCVRPSISGCNDYRVVSWRPYFGLLDLLLYLLPFLLLFLRVLLVPFLLEQIAISMFLARLLLLVASTSPQIVPDFSLDFSCSSIMLCTIDRASLCG